MPIRIEYTTRSTREIDLCADGSISVHTPDGRFDIQPAQAAMLKAMILAEAELMRQAQR